jgi:glutamyl-Q tRNA(Asp) synthetase
VWLKPVKFKSMIPADAHPPPPGRHRGRFAPSPTGPLHFGSLLAAFGSWLLARHRQGEWLVRIEDVDRPREVAGAARDQLRVLAAFGLVSDGPVLRQSERGDLYQHALDRLLASGQAFVCHCSRSHVAAAGGIHRHCAPRVRRRHPATRLRVVEGNIVSFEDGIQGPQAEDVAAAVGDFVLRRADGCWAYQLAVVVDDADQGITDVVRGADLLASTPRQILLQRALGLPEPRYAHLPLIVDEHARKLSKSHSALPVDPADPLPVLRAAWKALGQEPAVLALAGTADAVLAAGSREFDPGRIPRVRMLPLAALHNTVDTAPV